MCALAVCMSAAPMDDVLSRSLLSGTEHDKVAQILTAVNAHAKLSKLSST